jgi:hypothetical protein
MSGVPLGRDAEDGGDNRGIEDSNEGTMMTIQGISFFLSRALVTTDTML